MTPLAYEEASEQGEPEDGRCVRRIMLPDLVRATRHAQMCLERSQPEPCMRPQAGRQEVVRKKVGRHGNEVCKASAPLQTTSERRYRCLSW